MRKRLCLVIALAGFAGGCLETRLHTTLDVHAQLDENTIEGTYDLPAGAPAVQLRTPATRVEIPPSLRSAQLEEAGIDLEATLAHRSGNADAAFAVFVSDSQDDLYDSEPLLVMQATLSPGLERQLATELAASPRLLDLMRRDQLFLGVGLDCDPAQAEAISGDYRIDALSLHITARTGGVTASMFPRVPWGDSR